jgi:hypothetical protein
MIWELSLMTFLALGLGYGTVDARSPISTKCKRHLSFFPAVAQPIDTPPHVPPRIEQRIDTPPPAQMTPESVWHQPVGQIWAGKSMIGPTDSIVTTFVLTIAADGKIAATTFPNREPIPTRIIAMGGDSIVTEAGPYQSVLRAGQTVKMLRIVAHWSGKEMTGTFEAQYANGDVLRGKIRATRRK